MNCALILQLDLLTVYSIAGVYCGSSSRKGERVKLRRQ